ncbi:MAG: 16S rRNA (cytosine(967)-C(5))-methyltransferase RsmB [bacterium]
MILDDVRRRALDVLSAVDEGRFLDEALDRAREGLDPGSREAARLHFLTTGSVKRRGRLDRELDHLLEQPLSKLPPGARAALRLGLFELREADTPPHAAVQHAVEGVKERGLGGLSGLVNAVLRRASREGEPELPEDPMERLAAETSHPLWMLEAVAAEWGREAAGAWAAWNNQPPDVWVRVDRSRREVEEAEERLRELGLETVRGPVPGYLRLPAGTVPGSLEGVAEGWLTVQDPSAGLAALAAVPPGGSRVLDLCGAPGGKATHLEELTGGETSVTATDSDPERRDLLEENARRHGGVRVIPWQDVMAGDELYDAVLVDAPCSNLGVLRRRADARWRLDRGEPVRMSGVQDELLREGAERTTPGGVLVYSTCTILPEENERVVDRFMADHTEFILQTLPEGVPETFRGRRKGTSYVLPWRHGLDGAFIACMRRGKK